MKLNRKYFIFMPLSEARNASLINAVKTFREPLYWHYPLALQPVGVVFLQGLFICPCFQTQHKSCLHSDLDKGACKRYTLIHKIIGSCKSCRHRWGENLDRLFAWGFFSFSSFLFSCCFRFSFLPFLF